VRNEFFIDGIPAEFVSWEHDQKDRIILLLHGGGCAIGSRNVYRDMAWRLAKAADARVLVTDYRLAPEHKYPAAHDDAFKAYQWLLDQGFDPRKIAVQGDSAGGSLALSLLQRLKKRSMPMPACCVLLSPWIDWALTGESYRTRKLRDPLLSRGLLKMYSTVYLGTDDPMDPGCSPLFGDVSALPPVLIHVGDDEVLLDDSRRFAEKAPGAGTDVTIEVWPKLFHVWHLWALVLPQARKAIDGIGEFCKEHAAVTGNRDVKKNAATKKKGNNMKHVEGDFTGIRDEKIFYQAWLPSKKPGCVVQIAHGVAEHSGRYMNVVNELVPRGIAVYANDHRGHGRSGGRRCYVESFNDYVEDAKIFFNIIRKAHPGARYFILGHSMGSSIAIRFLISSQSLLSGAVLSGFGNNVGGDVNAVLKALSAVGSMLFPKVTVKATDLSKYISRDKQVVDDYINDPLNFLDGLSARLGNEILKVFPENDRLVPQISIPLLAQAGSKDRIVLGAKDLAEKFAMKDKKIKIYDGLYHECYNELVKDRKKVLKDLGNWIVKHMN